MLQLHVLDQAGGIAVIPSIEMAAAGLDSIGAIVGYAVCSGISITSGSLVYSILSGPLQVVLLICCLWHSCAQCVTASSIQHGINALTLAQSPVRLFLHYFCIIHSLLATCCNEVF